MKRFLIFFCSDITKVNSIYCTLPDKVNEELGNININIDFLMIELNIDPEPISSYGIISETINYHIKAPPANAAI